MKNRADVTTPAGDTRLIGALTAVEGTTTVSVVAVRGAIGVVAMSPKSTRVTLARLVPLIVTSDPRKPLSGTKDVIVCRAIVGDGDGVGVGVMTGWNVGRLKVGTAIVGGTFSVKLGGGVSDADGTATEGDGGTDVRVVANAVGEGSTTTSETFGDALVDGPGATVPMPGTASCASGEPLALAGFSRSQALRTSASANSAATRPTTTRPK